MDISRTMLTEAAGPPEILPNVKGMESAPDEQKKKLARDFESLLAGKLLDEMGNTVGDWGEEDDQAFGQIKGIFNLYLSQYVGGNGGLGLWREIYESLSRLQQKGGGQSQAVDKQI